MGEKYPSRRDAGRPYRLERGEVRPLGEVVERIAAGGYFPAAPDLADQEAIEYVRCPEGHPMVCKAYRRERGYRVIGVCEPCSVAVEV